MTLRISALAIVPLLALSACQTTTNPQARHDLASSIAQSGRMTAERSSIAAPLPVLAYTRMTQEGAPARIYIEGDGLAFLSRTRKSPDPTPTNPIALRLAALDRASNVAWIGRACQYAGRTGTDRCHSQYWTTARFSAEAVDAVERELDILKRTHGIPSFELVGFSGGGAIAALLAARRDDVTCLRSVAGNIDHDAFSAVHNTTPLDESLNPAAQPGRLVTLPQIHYVGGKDTIVPQDVATSFRRKVAPKGPFDVVVIPSATHEAGWDAVWPQLVAQDCDTI